MEESFKIYIHHLKNRDHEEIEESFDPVFLEISETDLKFEAKVRVKGNAALAEDVLVLSLGVQTEASMPCAICNTFTTVPIEKNFQFIEEISNIKNGVFNFKEELREAILLEVPQIAECHSGNCPERGLLKKYFSHKDKSAFPLEF